MSIRPSLIFDLDGTLVDSISDIVAAVNRTIDRFDVNPISPNEVGYLTGQGGLRVMISHAFEKSDHPLNEELLGKLFSICVDDYTENIAVETKLYPGVRSSLEHFKAEGWLLGICTNKPFDLAKNLMSKLDVEGMFSYIAGVDSFDFKKPDPRHLTRTIELCGGITTQAILVGDTELDVTTARNADIPIIGVDFGYSEQPIESYAPDAIVSRYNNLFDEANRLMTELRT